MGGVQHISGSRCHKERKGKWSGVDDISERENTGRNCIKGGEGGKAVVGNG